MLARAPIVTGCGRASAKLPQFAAVNTILGDLTAGIAGTYHAFKFGKYLGRYQAEFQYRFNRRYRLQDMLPRLVRALAAEKPRATELSADMGGPRSLANQKVPSWIAHRASASRSPILGFTPGTTRNPRRSEHRGNLLCDSMQSTVAEVLDHMFYSWCACWVCRVESAALISVTPQFASDCKQIKLFSGVTAPGPVFDLDGTLSWLKPAYSGNVRPLNPPVKLRDRYDTLLEGRLADVDEWKEAIIQSVSGFSEAFYPPLDQQQRTFGTLIKLESDTVRLQKYVDVCPPFSHRVRIQTAVQCNSLPELHFGEGGPFPYRRVVCEYELNPFTPTKFK